MICSTVEEDVVRPATARRAATETMTTTTAVTEPLRMLTPSDDLLCSVRSSIVSNASVSDLKRDQHSVMLAAAAHVAHTTSHTGAAPAPTARRGSRSKKTRIEEKIKLIAQYIKNVSMGLSHRSHRTAAAPTHENTAPNSNSSHRTRQLVKRKSQVTLSQYSQPRSAPDVLGSQKNVKAATSISSQTARASSSSQQTSLSWDEICAGAIFVEENEVMPASPRSRKRGRRSSELFDEAELRRLCTQCDVPEANADDVVKMVMNHFGTCQLDLTVFHELVGGNSVVVIGMLVFACIDCGEELLDLRTLPVFLRHIQSRYNENNPFHNACHAADVLHSLFMMLWTTQLGVRVAVHNQIGVLFAAIMHDIEHIGLTNDFLLKTNHEIALKYATRAPMEEMHTAVALDLLADPRFNVLAKMCNDQLEQVHGIVRETIQSTALCYQKDLLRDVASISADEWDATSSVMALPLQTIALRCAMHVSDISQTMKPFAIHSKWVSRLNEELFLQGDLDQRMRYSVCPDSCFRHKWSQDAFLNSQVWFLENLALPAAKGFNSIPWLNALILEDNLQANIAQWQAQLSSSKEA